MLGVRKSDGVRWGPMGSDGVRWGLFVWATYGIDEASLLEGDEFELVGKCIFIYCGLRGSYGVRWGLFVWGMV